MRTNNSAREVFLEQLPSLSLKTFLIKASLVTLLTLTVASAISEIIERYFKNTIIDSATNKFPEVTIYIPAIIIGFFIIYDSNLAQITKSLFSKVTNKSKRLFFTFLVLDLIITILFGLF